MAWGCLTANLAMPGFGSFAAGQKLMGVAQASLALSGMMLSLVFAIRFVGWYTMNRAALSDMAMDDPAAAWSAMWQGMRWALAGIAMFAVAWTWSLLSSLAALRRAKHSAAKPAPPPLA